MHDRCLKAAGRPICAGWRSLLVPLSYSTTGTAIILYYTISDYRRFWRRWRFWVAVAVLLTIHLIAYIAVLLKVEDFKIIWIALFTPAEVVALTLGLNLALRGDKRDGLP